MIKSINQAMVNRSIAGGGNCKCINGNGINGGSNGGKITVEFNVYSVEVQTTNPRPDTEQHIMKEDAEKVFNAILSVDPEKYVFYHVSIDDDQSGLIDMTCMQTFSKISDEDGDYSTIALNDTIPPIGAMLFTIYISYTPNKIIDYTDSLIGEYKIDDSITGTIITTYICKYTLYYMER